MEEQKGSGAAGVGRTRDPRAALGTGSSAPPGEALEAALPRVETRLGEEVTACSDPAYFTPKLPLISHESCHPFQGKVATDFTPKLPPPAGG